MQFHLKNLEVMAFVGVYDEEKTKPQKLLINVWFEFDATAAAASDDLMDTIDYATLEHEVRKIAQQKHYELLEHLHLVLRQTLTQNFPAAANLKVSLEKFPFRNGSIVVS